MRGSTMPAIQNALSEAMDSATYLAWQVDFATTDWRLAFHASGTDHSVVIYPWWDRAPLLIQMASTYFLRASPKSDTYVFSGSPDSLGSTPSSKWLVVQML
jgi:hypothetical protein